MLNGEGRGGRGGEGGREDDSPLLPGALADCSEPPLEHFGDTQPQMRQHLFPGPSPAALVPLFTSVSRRGSSDSHFFPILFSASWRHSRNGFDFISKRVLISFSDMLESPPWGWLISESVDEFLNLVQANSAPWRSLPSVPPRRCADTRTHTAWH